MKIAIIHYWLIKMRGGEKVLENICDIYPQADIYTHVLDKENISSKIKKHNIFTTFIDKLPNSKKLYKYYLPLMPLGLKLLNLRSYDLIISSESGPSKGIVKNYNAKHVCYCHSPMRYIWDMSSVYYNKFNIFEKIGYNIFSKYLKRWDVKSSNDIDLILANSLFVKNRIKNNWKKDSKILNPTINFQNYKKNNTNKEYYIVVSEHASYKRLDIVIEAFNQINKKLIIIGDGPLLNKHIKLANENIKILGFLDDNKKNEYISYAKALIFPGIEDFGIVPLEAMAYGKPVIAFNGGGAIEYLRDGINSKLFNEQNANSLIIALNFAFKVL